MPQTLLSRGPYPAGISRNRREMMQAIYGEYAGFSLKQFSDLALLLESSEMKLQNNAAVIEWGDLSGKGNGQSIASGSPTFQTNIQGGQPAVYFDGNDAMTGNALFSGAGARTVIAVYR